MALGTRFVFMALGTSGVAVRAETDVEARGHVGVQMNTDIWFSSESCTENEGGWGKCQRGWVGGGGGGGGGEEEEEEE
jgi:hypothetical protein